MLSFEILRYIIILAAFSVAMFISEIVYMKKKDNSNHKILAVVEAVLLLIGLVFFVWLLFNKEMFHWNFDIATGEPVDHYSTYGRCMIGVVVSILSNMIAIVMRMVRKKKNKEENQ